MNLDDENFSVNDPFLNLLCFDNDTNNEVDVSFVEDWSENEQDYEKDVEDDDYEDEGVMYHCYNPYMDWKLKFHGVQFKNLFWAGARSTSKKWYEQKMEELKTTSKNVYCCLVEKSPITWSRAFFEVGRAYDAFENGMNESFNSRLRVARRKPIISMLEEIRTFVMRRMFLMSTKSKGFEHEGSMHWPKTNDIKPSPPKKRRMPGRPTVKRKRGSLEKDKKNTKIKIRRKMTCQNCQEVRHNIKSCKNDKKDPQPKEPRPNGRLRKVVSKSITDDETFG
ncbi:hypothetical protein E3N88_37518 [Mikania micrantha]|uniref:Transposase MuDR plant domain-containing protein n=1 Tax=Mikania micrantha TaxID=192012 RepID=A0A5N6LRF7_9ASTR|nr:hypothetical protein E3N88_37518 [Mikania micrantha]